MCTMTDSNHSQNETDPFELLHTMEVHSDGFSHLGDDGVLRSFHPNGTVIDHVKLSTKQIQRMVDGHGRNAHLTEVFDGVNGHSVSNEQATNPAKHLLPVPFRNSTKPAVALQDGKASCDDQEGCNATDGKYVPQIRQREMVRTLTDKHNQTQYLQIPSPALMQRTTLLLPRTTRQASPRLSRNEEVQWE